MLINLSDLLFFAANPVRYFLKRSLGIRLKEVPSSKEKFVLSYRKRYLFQKEVLKKPVGELFQEMEKQGSLPPSPFKEIEKRKLFQEAEKIKSNLKGLSLFDLPLSVTIGDVEIRGKLENLSEKGLVLLDKEEPFSLIKNWPAILLFFHLQKERVEPNLIFAKSGSVKSSSFEDLTLLLEKYLDYFLKSQKEPSFLVKSEEDAYFQWAFPSQEKTKPDETFSPLLERLL